MKTKTIELFSFAELSKEAQEKAHNEWREKNDYFFLQDCMNEWLHEELEENKIKDINGEYDVVNQVRPKNKAHVFYSLSSSQGDGVCFEGNFEWKGYIVKIKHSGRYYHSNSKTIDIYHKESDEPIDNLMEDKKSEKIYAQFEKIYQSICKTLENRGYDFIEYEDSLESFEQQCEANEWTFTSDGKMEN